MSNELNWHPPTDDPAFMAGYEFVQRHRDQEYINRWLVRQAFWCGVKWARENSSLPLLGTIVDGGKVEWTEDS